MSSKLNQEKIRTQIKEVKKEIYAKFLGDWKEKEGVDITVKGKEYLRNIKTALLNDFIKSEHIDERLKLYEFIQEIEEKEIYLNHLWSLLSIKSTKDYGLWQSNYIERFVRIKGLNVPKSVSRLMFKNELNDNIAVYDENLELVSNGLKDIYKFNIDDSKENFASLSVNLQLTNDSRSKEEKVFLKIQIVNTSTPFQGKTSKSFYSTANEKVNLKTFFGVQIKLENKNLVPYSSPIDSKKRISDDEENINLMLYKDQKVYGIGHGCSIIHEIERNKKAIMTEYIPHFDTPDVEFIPRKKGELILKERNSNIYIDAPYFKETKFLQFKWLSVFSEATDQEIINGLLEFVNAYGSWIKTREKHHEYEDIAKKELEKCSEDYQRMRKNIEVLLCSKENRQNLHCFRLMNAVMFMQLWHGVTSEKDEVERMMSNESFLDFDFEFYKFQRDDLFDEGQSATWRPFQLAFILLNLDGIFQLPDDNSWTKRNDLVDLVWFPTGGGKTESYLGIIALTIINRRKCFPAKGGGTTVIMRYTLRLLTLQQFQRATLLIMALELCRRWELYDLGEEPICIGLWVGDSQTPNKTENLKKEYEKLNENKPNRLPFSECPWCHSKLKGETLESISGDVYQRNKIPLRCMNKKCAFFHNKRKKDRKKNQGPLPICLSDEIIYEHPPTLLFGTADKFAALAHKVSNSNKNRNKDSRRLFGVGNWENGKPQEGYLPPDLIIQDELHLLLGPLGSAVAQFEAAIDQLSTRKDGTRPKIISSTATARNTEFQIEALFDRNVNVFPKPGIKSDDSFFAYHKREYKNIGSEKTYTYTSNRKYLGVMTNGKGSTWMQMRLTAIILTHRALFELNELKQINPIDSERYSKELEQVMNNYHTLVSYFSSLNEVAKTQAQLDSYLIREVRRVFNRVIRPRKLMQRMYAYSRINSKELTGRISGQNVKTTLKSISNDWKASDRLKKNKTSSVPEFLAATNMISVGVDVPRLNTMLVNSMPKNLAEYIQATSRVARKHLGLVVTIHNPYRSRDVSHYERFIEFHEKMYTYVEPISVTPFTNNAIDKFMGLYLATLIRHDKIASLRKMNSKGFIERESASEFHGENMENKIDEIVKEMALYFNRRIEKKETLDKGESGEQSLNVVINQCKIEDMKKWWKKSLTDWNELAKGALEDKSKLVFNNKSDRSKQKQLQLFVDMDEYKENVHSYKWKIPHSLRVIEPQSAIKINKF